MPRLIDRRNLMTAGALCFAMPTLTGCATQSVETRAPRQDQIDYIQSKMQTHRVPGAGIALIRDGAVAWAHSFGFANLDTRQPITPKTLFQAASLSKPLFAYVVMQAVERGIIGLDEPLSETARPVGLSDTPWSHQITVRDVLQHTTGLPNWRPMEEALELKPAYRPGTDSSYSGEAYTWLQLVLETRTGQGLDRFMRTSLFEPANLDDMSMLWEPERDAREVYGHRVNDDDTLIVRDLQFAREQGWRLHEIAERWRKPMRAWTIEDQARALTQMRPHSHARLKDRPDWRWTHPNYLQINSPATLRTTVTDYARFACLMMPGRDREFWELSETHRQFMLTPQFHRPEVQGGVLPRGIGWGLETRDTGMAYYHWGSNSNTHISVVLCDLSDRSGLVIMTNAGTGRGFIKDIVLELTGRTYISVSTS